MRALCFCVIMISYLVFFMYISNHMIFLQQFGINEHMLIFSRTTNCTRPTGSCNLLVLIYSKLFEIMWLPILICFSGPNKHHIDRRDYICLGQKQRKKVWERLKILDILSIFTVPIISGGWLLIFNIVFNQANLPVMEDYRVIDNYQNNQTLLTNSALHKLRTHIHFTQLRFHCHKKNGSTFHIVTKTDEKGEAVIQYFTGQTETVPTSWIISENGRRRFRARQELQLVGKNKFCIQVWHMGHRGETWVVRCSYVYWRITSLDDKSKRRQMGMWWLPWPATLSVASSPDSGRFLEDFYSLNTNNGWSTALR